MSLLWEFIDSSVSCLTKNLWSTFMKLHLFLHRTMLLKISTWDNLTINIVFHWQSQSHLLHPPVSLSLCLTNYYPSFTCLRCVNCELPLFTITTLRRASSRHGFLEMSKRFKALKYRLLSLRTNGMSADLKVLGINESTYNTILFSSCLIPLHQWSAPFFHLWVTPKCSPIPFIVHLGP